MAVPSENVSSYINHIMQKLIQSDEIVKAIANNKPNFLSNEFEISDDEIPDSLNYLTLDNDKDLESTNVEIIKGQTIYRNALKYSKITPIMYKDEVIEKQKTMIYFSVEFISDLSFASKSIRNTNLLGGYMLNFKVFTHDDLIRTNYGKLRQLYITEQIEKLLLYDTIGRHNFRSLDNVVLKYNTDLSLYNGKFYGRHLQFLTSGFNVKCNE